LDTNNEVLTAKRIVIMAEKGFVWVKDKAGNEFVCHIDDLKDPKKISAADLKNCIDDASRAINIGD
jgi:predicted membrane-bound spermidine synthase